MKCFPISMRYLPAAVLIEVWIIVNVISSHTIEHQSCKCCTYTCTASCLCQCWLQHAKQDQDAIKPFLFNLQNVIISPQISCITCQYMAHASQQQETLTFPSITMKKLEQISVVKISSKTKSSRLSSSESLKIMTGTLLLKYRRITEAPRAWQTITNHINPIIKKTCSKDLASSNLLPDPDIKPASSMQWFTGPKNTIILGDKF